MGNVLIIGAGGVGSVVVKKCCQVPEVFTSITLASRTLSKCEQIQKDTKNKIKIAQVDADDSKQVIALIQKVKPDIVINTALPYQNLAIMEGCLQTGVHYIDTACYEPYDEAKYSYVKQWAYHDKFKEKGLMAILGLGFDPGMTNIYLAHAFKNHFDQIHTVDILDANAGDHGHPFATNFNPEINIREITQRGKYLENGQWKETDPLSVHKTFDFPGIGPKEVYMLYHEELEPFHKHHPEIKNIRFWMTFSQNYLNHLKVLENVGMTSIKPVKHNGVDIIPIQFLKSLLPDPGSLGVRTKGKTCIGLWIEGVKNNKPKKYHIYNICDHEDCFKDVGSQAISYTTGVPTMVGALMMLQGKWKGVGCFNPEQLNPTPFMEVIGRYGLPWTEVTE